MGDRDYQGGAAEAVFREPTSYLSDGDDTVSFREAVEDLLDRETVARGLANPAADAFRDYPGHRPVNYTTSWRRLQAKAPIRGHRTRDSHRLPGRKTMNTSTGVDPFRPTALRNYWSG